MSGPLGVLLGNALAAAALALLAAAAQRWLRPRPAIVHALWAVVLLRLLAPPLWPVALFAVPDWPAASTRPTAPAARTAPAPSARAALAVSRADAQVAAAGELAPRRPLLAEASPAIALLPSATDALSGLVALGAVAVLGIGIWRSRQFRRLLAGATPAPPALRARGEELASRVGLARCPEIWLVPARVPPMLWFGRRRPRVLLPRELWADLDSEQADTLLVHELAHVLRRDHWVRLLELLTTALFWWYPLAWWARARLREVEERCCDEWVARLLPRAGRAYAEGLLKTLSFLSADDRPLPAAATGARPQRDLESRLKEILMSRSTPRLAGHSRTLLVLAAGLGLTVFPTWAERDSGPPEPQPVVTPGPGPRPSATPPEPSAPSGVIPGSRVAPESDESVSVDPAAENAAADPALAEAVRTLRQQRLALRQESLKLEQKERALRRSELQLEAKQQEAQVLQEQSRLESSLAALSAEASARERQLLQQQIERTGQRLQLGRQRLALEVDQLERLGRLETEIQQRQLAAEAAEAAGQERESEKLRAAIDELEAQLERAQLEIEGRQAELEDKLSANELAAEREAMELEHLDQGRELDRRARELEAQTAERQLGMAARQAELQARAVERQVRAKEREAELAEGQGREQEARALRQQAEGLARQAASLRQQIDAQAGAR